VTDRARLVASVLREHQRTTGMAPAMGTTCRCGTWCTGSTDRTARGVPLRDRRVDDLAQHQADMVLAALAAPASGPCAECGGNPDPDNDWPAVPHAPDCAAAPTPTENPR
jgi:hypothetical protein